jgi:hypothetical protein
MRRVTGDDGSADPDVRAALAAAADGAEEDVAALAALQRARLLVPVVAVLQEEDRQQEKRSEMATVLVTGATGRRALLAFTGIDSLQAWRADARPVPVAARDAAAAALAEGAQALVVDLAGPVQYAVEGDDLQGLASGWSLARVGGRTAWVLPNREPGPNRGPDRGPE